MALRMIRTDEDPVLRKQTREIREITPRIRELAEDMLETMYQAEGVGLAAPQIGVLRKIIVIDVGEGPYTMINPVLSNPKGAQIQDEACLSFPHLYGNVERPEEVDVTYLDLDGVEHHVTCTGLFARCVCHETDHLNGTVFLDRVIPGTLQDDREELEAEEETLDE